MRSATFIPSARAGSAICRGRNGSSFVKGRPSAKSQGLPRTDRIVSIDQSGPETAFVKLECSIHPRYFTDYLLLLKGKDGWRIVSKSFRTETRP
jgi:hypothetical protein